MGDAPSSLDEVPRWSLEGEIRIDGHEHDLVPIQYIAVSDDGTIAISQQQDYQVRLFDVNGNPLATIGRRGGGPGEFQSPVRLGWIADTLWVNDITFYRLTLFRSGGDVVRIISYPRVASGTLGGRDATELGPFWPNTLNPDGTLNAMFLGRNTIGGMALGRMPPRPALPTGTVYVQMTQTGEIVGEIARIWATPSRWGPIALADGAYANGPYPFANEVAVDMSDDGDYVGIVVAAVDGDSAGTFRAVRIAQNGDTIYDRRHPFDAVRIPRALADSAIAGDSERWAQGWGRADVAAYIRRNAYVPDVYPPIVEVVAAADGSVWIRMLDTDAGRPYLVLDPAGGRAGHVIVARNVEIRHGDAEHVWAVEVDEFGVESVVRFGIKRT